MARVFFSSLLLLLTFPALTQTGENFFVLDKSEACQGDLPFKLSGHLTDDAFTPLPPGGRFKVENCLNPPCDSTSIIYEATEDCYYFDPSVSEDSYIITYILGSAPFETVFLGQLDIQAANSQILTLSEAVCPNQTILLQANPTGGRFTGNGLDSFPLGSEFSYFFNPTELIPDSSYRVDYSYFLVAASGLVCADTSSVELKVYEEFSFELKQMSISACSNTAIEFGELLIDEEEMIDFTWYNPDLGILSTELAFTTDTISTSGVYHLHGINSNGCQDTKTVEINITTPPFLNCIVENKILCHEERSASIILEIDDDDLSFSWSDGINLSNRNNLGSGTYSLTVTNEQGCSSSCSVNIEQPQLLQINCDGNLTDPTCYLAEDGTNELMITGGVSPYLVSLDNMQFHSEKILTGLGHGTHTVFVRDDNDCLASCDFLIENPAKDSCVIMTTKNISCHGNSDGSLSVFSTLDLSTSEIVWDHNESAVDLEGLSAGTYSVQITSNSGCKVTCLTLLSEPDPLVLIQKEIVPLTCYQDESGGITLGVSGGVAPFETAWSDGNQSQIRENLSAGTYGVTVTDANGCVLIDSFIVEEPIALVLRSESVPISCNGGSDGRINLFAEEDITTLDVLWSHGPTDYTLTNLSAGTYYVTITNDSGCQDSLQVTLTEPDVLELEVVEKKDAICYDTATGSLDLMGSGGNPPYVVLWSDGLDLISRKALSADAYTLTVTDSKGCSSTHVFVIDEPEPLTIQFESTPVSCKDGSDGSITLMADVGLATMDIQWAQGPIESSLTDLAASTYAVTITNEIGCQDSLEISVSEIPQLQIHLQANKAVTCHGGHSGAIDLTISGGSLPYTSIWSDSLESLSRENLSAGTYTLSVTDDNGCSQTETFQVEEPDPIAITYDYLPVSCHSGSDGSITLDAPDGLTDLEFFWAHGPTTSSVKDLPAGNYMVTIADTSDCHEVLQIEITEPELLRLSLDSLKNANCHGEETGVIDLTLSGGEAPYEIIWSNGASGLSRSGLGAGAYEVLISDANHCEASGLFLIDQPEEFILTGGTKVSCLDEKIILNVDVMGRDPLNLKYSWSIISADLDLINLEDRMEIQGTELVFDALDLDEGEIIFICVAEDENGCQAASSYHLILQSCFDLALRKRVQGRELKSVDDPVIFEITVFNQGSITAYDLEIEDTPSSDLIFLPGKNNTNLTGNPHRWTRKGLNATTRVDSLTPGDSIQLIIYFDLVNEPSTTLFRNFAKIISYSSANKILPIDQDDLIMQPAKETDDTIDDDSLGGADDPYDDDKCDFAISRICPDYEHAVHMEHCGHQEPDIILNPELRAELDPEGDGDGDTSDGDVGNLIASFHYTRVEALEDESRLDLMDFNVENVYARLVTLEGCAFAVEFSLMTLPMPEIEILEEEIYTAIGETVTLSVEKKIDHSYQWQIRDEKSFVNMPEATSNELRIPIDNLSQKGSEFRVEVSRQHSALSCAQTSNSVMLIIPDDPPSCVNRINVSLDNSCALNLSPGQLTTGSLYDDDLYSIIYKDKNGNIVTDEWGNHIGEELIFEVINNFNESKCWGFLNLIDQTPPRIVCPSSMTLSCLEKPDSSLVRVTDNCGEFMLQLSFELSQKTCLLGTDNIVSSQQMTVTAQDKSGNVSTPCTTTLYLTAPQLDVLDVPKDTILSGDSWDHDDSGYPEPYESGYVLHDTIPLPIDSLLGTCQLHVSYEDQIVNQGSDTYLIRTWVMVDLCSGNIRSESQLITLPGVSLLIQEEDLNIRSVESINTSKKEEIELTLSPNPFRNSIKIKLNASVKKSLLIDVYNLEGRHFHSQSILVEKGAREIVLDSEVFRSETGLFMLVVTGEGVQFSKPVLRI